MHWFRSRLQSKRLHSEQGSEVAEAAVILPVLFLLLFGVYWFGQAFSIYGTINHAAREGARTAAVPECAGCNDKFVWQTSSLPSDDRVLTAVGNALSTAGLDPNQTQVSTPTPLPQFCPGVFPTGGCTNTGTGTQGVTICRNVQLDQGSNSPVTCGVIVSFQYPYQLNLPFSSLNNQPIMLKAQFEMQGEN
jgi:hypothetical protein